MTGYRPEFEAAARMFAAISVEIDARGFLPPVLVGRAAAELYSGSDISTGDFDIVTARDDVFFEVLRNHGFVEPSNPGHTFPGWYHPALMMGFEVVGSSLLDGHVDRERIQLFSFDEELQIAVIPPEDLIADRMGQFASGTAPEMGQQAKTLFALCKDLDLHYMDMRIREETDGQYGISDLTNEA
jgi:hypothetical protein